MILYHISPNPNLPSILYPRQPSEVGDEEPCPKDKSGKFIRERYTAECAPPRVSFSETLLGCLQATFAWNQEYFGEDVPADSVADFHVYSPVYKSSKRWMSPDEITEAGYTWDAWFTKEWISLDPVKVKRIGMVRYYNGPIECELIVPFRTGEYSKIRGEVCPKSIEYDLFR